MLAHRSAAPEAATYCSTSACSYLTRCVIAISNENNFLFKTNKNSKVIKIPEKDYYKSKKSKISHHKRYVSCYSNESVWNTRVCTSFFLWNSRNSCNVLVLIEVEKGDKMVGQKREVIGMKNGSSGLQEGCLQPALSAFETMRHLNEHTTDHEPQSDDFLLALGLNGIRA